MVTLGDSWGMSGLILGVIALQIPYLMETMRIRREEDRTYYEAQQVEARAAHERQWAADLEAKRRTARMTDDLCVPPLYPLFYVHHYAT